MKRSLSSEKTSSASARKVKSLKKTKCEIKKRQLLELNKEERGRVKLSRVSYCDWSLLSLYDFGLLGWV